ncbi:MAG: hypothetical protein AB1571_02245 [Nanoarchaeota archaeon]
MPLYKNVKGFYDKNTGKVHTEIPRYRNRGELIIDSVIDFSGEAKIIGNIQRHGTNLFLDDILEGTKGEITLYKPYH